MPSDISDAIARARRDVAMLSNGTCNKNHLCEVDAAFENLAALGPASVDLACRLYVGHVWQCDLEPSNCLDRKALQDWADAQDGEERNHD